MVVLVYGLAYGIVRGTESAARSLRDAYRANAASLNKLLSGGKGKPAAGSRSNGAGVKVGAAAATGATGLAMAGRGFAQGFRAGWPEGRKRAHDRWGGQPEQAAEVTSTEAATGPAGDTTADAKTPAPGSSTDRPPLRLVSDSEPAAAGADPNVPAPGGASTTEGDDMAVSTLTGGEVTTMAGLVAELGTIIEEASADLEDAQGDAQRAKEDMQRIDVMVASLRSMDLDRQTLAEVGGLAEPAFARQAAAEQRAAAAEARHSQAITARDGVNSRHQVMAEAHAATPHAADKEFYTG